MDDGGERFRRIGERGATPANRPPFWSPAPLERPRAESPHAIVAPDFERLAGLPAPAFAALELYVEDFTGTALPPTVQAYDAAAGFLGVVAAIEELTGAPAPSGTFSEPRFDLDQGYDWWLAERGDIVYYAAGAWDAGDDAFTTYWQTPGRRYREAWARACEDVRRARDRRDPALAYPVLRRLFGLTLWERFRDRTEASRVRLADLPDARVLLDLEAVRVEVGKVCDDDAPAGVLRRLNAIGARLAPEPEPAIARGTLARLRTFCGG